VCTRVCADVDILVSIIVQSDTPLLRILVFDSIAALIYAHIFVIRK
jgi:hypothetical protein